MRYVPKNAAYRSQMSHTMTNMASAESIGTGAALTLSGAAAIWGHIAEKASDTCSKGVPPRDASAMPYLLPR